MLRHLTFKLYNIFMWSLVPELCTSRNANVSAFCCSQPFQVEDSISCFLSFTLLVYPNLFGKKGYVVIVAVAAVVVIYSFLS